ncbi:MAG: alpha/beta hydrolase [Candidatus Pacebacteria bacterium]|nr:alpha/beta hydrolase [Candidatus Paceibacterota bacterium]
MPMLVIVGDQDTSCPAEHQNIFFDALPHKENKQLIILENQQHNFYTEADCDVLTAAISKYLHDYYHASL